MLRITVLEGIYFSYLHFSLIYPRYKPKPMHLTRVSRLTNTAIMFPLALAQIRVLLDSRLLYNCYGLTRQNWSSNDLSNDRKPGYATIRFGDGTQDGARELDYLCPEVKAGFGLTVVSQYVPFQLRSQILFKSDGA